MTMSTQTLLESARLLAGAVLHDSLQICSVGEPVTVGINVERPITNLGEPVPGLVQTTILGNAIESRTDAVYSIKVARGTALSAGQAVKVVSCVLEPDLIGKILLIDKISKNGLAMIRKAIASDSEIVDQQGKGDLE